MKAIHSFEALEHSIESVMTEYAGDDKDPGSDKWVVNNRYYRPKMLADVKSTYTAITDTDEHEFPFNDDFVAQAWITRRKKGVPKGRCYDLSSL